MRPAPECLIALAMRLGGDEVRGGLDPGRRPFVQVDRDDRRQRAAVGQRLQSRPDPAVGEDRRIDAAGQVAQLAQGLGDAGAGLCDQLLRALRVGLELLLRHPEAHAERDQPGLRAVVQVALDAAELGVLLLDRAQAGRLERLDAAGEAVAPLTTRDQVVHDERARQAEQRPGGPEVPA